VPTGAPVIGAVGKLAAGRGFGLVLAAAARLEGPAHIVVVGHGELQPELEKRSHELGLAGRVHWAGYQDETLPALYSAMDIVFFTAPGSDWGHRTISEAQGCGRPVIAASYPGVEDLVEDGVTGRLVSRDPVALAAAAKSLIKDPEKPRRMGDAAAEAAAERRFAPVGERFVRFLETILAK
jgi:glycosyltransferase involved in cell wall biosynthesis